MILWVHTYPGSCQGEQRAHAWRGALAQVCRPRVQGQLHGHAACSCPGPPTQFNAVAVLTFLITVDQKPPPCFHSVLGPANDVGLCVCHTLASRLCYEVRGHSEAGFLAWGHTASMSSNAFTLNLS